MRNILVLFQAILSVALVGLILLQAKGTGFGTNFSGSQSYLTKRGLEKIVFTGTIGLLLLWISVSVWLLFP